MEVSRRRLQMRLVSIRPIDGDAAEDVAWIDDKCPAGKHKGGRGGRGAELTCAEQQRWSM